MRGEHEIIDIHLLRSTTPSPKQARRFEDVEVLGQIVRRLVPICLLRLHLPRLVVRLHQAMAQARMVIRHNKIFLHLRIPMTCLSGRDRLHHDMIAVEIVGANLWKIADPRGEHLDIRVDTMNCVVTESIEANEILGTIKMIGMGQVILLDERRDRVGEKITHLKATTGDRDIRDLVLRKTTYSHQENTVEERTGHHMVELGRAMEAVVEEEELRESPATANESDVGHNGWCSKINSDASERAEDRSYVGEIYDGDSERWL